MATRARSKRPVGRSRRPGRTPPARTPPARTPIDRLRAICLALPEASEKIAWGEPTWRVKGKLFAQLDNHHHGADHLAVWLPAPLGEQESLVFLDPQRFFRPPYVGPRGWVGVRIDGRPDWKLVASLVQQAYREVAPPRLREAVKMTPPRVLERRRD
jgi:predicted DNA-binding protein (MmcQ/YjbR family)